MRQTLVGLQQATERKDYSKLCDKVLARELTNRLQSVGIPCEVALRTGLGSVREPRLEVGKVKMMGSRAAAEVRTTATGQQASTDTVRLIKEEGDWRVASLSGTGPVPPRRPPPEAEEPHSQGHAPGGAGRPSH